MGVSLSKGQRVNLSKEAPGLKNVMVGLGWDPIKQKKGFFKAITSSDIDCDASAIILRNGKYQNNKDLVYFGHLRHDSGAVEHMGDNLTGDGDGDDEEIQVQLNRMPEDVNEIIVCVNIYAAYSRKQNFGMIDNAFIRLVDTDRNVELCKYSLSNNTEYSKATAMILGRLVKESGAWTFEALGEPLNVKDINDIVSLYR